VTNLAKEVGRQERWFADMADGSNGTTPSAITSQFADDAVHEALAPIESTIAQSQQMITRHHDTSPGPPFEQIQQIVAEAGL
jgi:hypothetical protein